jgi:PLP dependent protein
MAMDQIQYNLKAIEQRIENACRESGRQRNELILVAVSKTIPFERIVEASNAGLTAFGENKVQEASNKIPRFNELGRTAAWHMIGHLQTNKAKQAVKLFDIIESIDSLKLAGAVDKEAKAENRKIDVLLEINSSGETSKYGFKPEEATSASEEIVKLENIRLRGLMTVGPFTEDRVKIEQAFEITQELFTCLKNKFAGNIDTLSMGMSDDLEYAIKHGCTELRIGTAIFGIRNYGLDSSPNQGGYKAI